MSSEGLHVPREKLKGKTLNLHYAITSLIEEFEAVDWYRQRADDCDDPTLEAILRHNAREELEHAAMVLEWIRRNDTEADEQLKEYLFTKGSITGREEDATGKNGGYARPEIVAGEIAADDENDAFDVRIVTLGADDIGRIDKVLADLVPEMSRARVQALIAQGRVSRDGAPVPDSSGKAQAGDYRIEIPPPEPAEPVPEAIPLNVLYEDEHLIVVDKPPGMAVHPAPGTPSGTLVNALLHHAGASLSGIGGVARPGIVHRIDKDTSGIVVVAKTDAAHQGLSALFAAHDIDRLYVALTRGAPKMQRGTIEGAIGRSSADRKKMAIVKSGGRHATTHYAVERIFGPPERPLAARVACTLETGRTHQIRVHLASQGSPCLGDPAYGSGPPAEKVRAAMAEAGLQRQALHAAVLGFRHPITGETLRFESPLPPDMATLQALLADL